MIPSSRQDIAPQGETARERRARLKRLDELGAVSGDLKDNVVSPISTTISMSGAVNNTTWRTGISGAHDASQLQSLGNNNLPTGLVTVNTDLGAAGGGLATVAGLHEFIKGVEQDDKEKAFSGATDVTYSAASMASAGLIGGSAVLGPAGGLLLSIRALKRMRKPDRTSKLNGAGDLLTGSVVLTAAAKIPLYLTLAAGVGATALAIVRGLHDIKIGKDNNDVNTETAGVGKFLAAAGVVLVTSGLALIPGIGLIVGGSLLPLLRKVPWIRRPLDKVSQYTARTLYPTANLMEKGLDKIVAAARPVTDPLNRGSQWLSKKLHPVTKPVKKLMTRTEDLTMHVARKGLDMASDNPVMRGLDDGVGFVMDRLPIPLTAEETGEAEANRPAEQPPG